MKQKLFTLFFALVAGVGTMFAWDYKRVQIGGLYYNLDATSQTAEVTSKNSSYPYWSTAITTAIIPASVEYNSVTYSVTSIGDRAFGSCTCLTSVTIPNSVTSIGTQAFAGCTGLTSVTIPNSVTSIGNYAFKSCKSLTSPVYNAHVFVYMPTSYSGAYTIPDGIESIAGGAFYECTGLTSVTIPNSVTSIGNYAFYYCIGLTSITCEVATPPTLKSNVFVGMNRSIPLYVPAGSVSAYKSAKQWKDFTTILPISAQGTETTSVQAEPTDNSVSVSWPQVSGAASYELVIKDKDGNVVCTLIFNAQGQLTSIAFHAPARDGAPQHTQTAVFSFTITGLEAGTDYNLTITAKNSNGQVVDKKEVSFHTNWPNAIENLQVEGDQPVKVYHNGQIYILRGEKVYTLTGQEVR